MSQIQRTDLKTVNPCYSQLHSNCGNMQQMPNQSSIRGSKKTVKPVQKPTNNHLLWNHNSFWYNLSVSILVVICCSSCSWLSTSNLTKSKGGFCFRAKIWSHNFLFWIIGKVSLEKLQRNELVTNLNQLERKTKKYEVGSVIQMWPKGI